MFRITSFPTPVSPLSSVVSSPYKSALTPQNNNSLANASGVPHQRQGAQIGNPARIIAPDAISFFRSESHLMLNRLFKFMGEGLPLTSEGRFDLQHVIEVARQKAKNAKNNHTVSQLWLAIAQLIDPKNHPDVTLNIHPNREGPDGIIIFSEFPIRGNQTHDLGCILPRGAKRAKHLEGLKTSLAFLEGYQVYLDGLKTESTPS
ncbi:MAG: hypothetical protein ACK551_07300 [Vampirovibrionales bacterium]